MKYTLLSILLTLVTFLQGQTYQVYNKNQESISFDLLASQLKDVDVVFFGEVHDDSIGHLAQLDLLQAIKKSTKNKVALSMEMFETDVQLVLNEYLEGKISEDVFVKDARAWPKYATDYKPLVEAMKSDGLHVIAANAPRRYVKMVTKNGLSALDKLSDQAKTYLAKLLIHVAKGKYEEKFAAVMEGHNMSGNTIYQSQNLWDATMAKSIHDYQKEHTKEKIIHVCGKFHCEESLGTVAQLQRLNGKIKTVVIISLPMSEYKEMTMEGKQKLGDYLVVTGI